jgi:hypothetical protein
MVEVFYMVRVTLPEADTLRPGENLLSRIDSAVEQAMPKKRPYTLNKIVQSASLKTDD